MSHGSVFGAWRPWCPPGFVDYVRRKFPNGVDHWRTAGGVLQYGLFEDFLKDETVMDALEEGGVDMGQMASMGWPAAEDYD